MGAHRTAAREIRAAVDALAVMAIKATGRAPWYKLERFVASPGRRHGRTRHQPASTWQRWFSVPDEDLMPNEPAARRT
jgi:hypothetical protein